MAQIPLHIHPNAMLPADCSGKTKHGRDTNMECLWWEIRTCRLPINLFETFLELGSALNHCQPTSFVSPHRLQLYERLKSLAFWSFLPFILSNVSLMTILSVLSICILADDSQRTQTNASTDGRVLGNGVTLAGVFSLTLDSCYLVTVVL